MDARAQDELRERVRSSRVVLSPRRWGQSSGREPGETEANKPGTPGRSRSSRSTIAQGVPDVSALPVVTTACVHHYPSCTRGCGCGQRPAFPAPSFFKGGLRCKARTRNRAAGMRRRASHLHRHSGARAERASYDAQLRI